MFDKYLICEESLENVADADRVTGFRLQVRITYYRGVTLSAIEGFEVNVDGQEFPREANLFTLRGQTYTAADMLCDVTNRWELGERAWLTIPYPGGLANGFHVVKVLELLRISYLPALSEGRDQKTMRLCT